MNEDEGPSGSLNNSHHYYQSSSKKSNEHLNASFENFDVLQLTKKIQQQTRSIEDEILKVQEILKKQQENSI